MKATIDIDKVWMASDPHGTLTFPVQVSGSWRLSARIWLGTKLLLLAACVMNLGVQTEFKAHCEVCGREHEGELPVGDPNEEADYIQSVDRRIFWGACIVVIAAVIGIGAYLLIRAW